MSLAVVTALAEAFEVDPLDLDPLYDYVDLETLTRLIDTQDASGDEFVIQFTYHGRVVHVYGSSDVTVQ